MEEKLNLKYQFFPTKLKSIKHIFFGILEEKAKEIIAKKVALNNGDIRIAFDLIKTSLSNLYQKVKSQTEGSLADDQIRVTY
jgi:hypothetical protein